MPEPAFLVDDADIITWVNLAGDRLLAESPRDIVGLDVASVLDREPALASAVVSSLTLSPGSPSARIVVVGGLLEPGGQGRPSGFGSDRAALLALMDEARPADTLGETTAALCKSFEGLDWVDGAIILLSPSSTEVFSVTDDTPAGLGFSFGGAIPVEQLDVVMAASQAGPWTLDMTDPTTRSLVGAPLVDAILSIGIRGAAYSAIRFDGELVAVLSIGSFRPDAAAFLAGRLDQVEDLARVAGVVMRAQALQFSRAARLRAQVRSAIQDRAFRPVFMPIVSTRSREVVGYEALTRFADGRPPDLWFADAVDAGVSLDLEAACARASLEAAFALPPDAPLALNFSPASILSGVVAEVVAGTSRPIVIEVTEHARIDSYEAIREAIASMPGVTLAVDDAGAGFASLRHILELRPQSVKLDLGLIRNVDSDPARAALIAGVVHFANQTGTELIAEGVETEAEAEALLALGVLLAQGYLFSGVP